MPETTENHHRIPFEDEGKFVSDSIRTITISTGDGIKGLIGKYKIDPGGSTHVMTYLFDVDKWTMAEAKEWVRNHKIKESQGGLWEAVWTAAHINELPDSSFIFIESGGEKDEDDKTKPRSLRHLPVKGSDGKYDPVHVRNALARVSQMAKKLPASALAKLEGIAKQLNIGESAEAKECVLTESYPAGSGIMQRCRVDRERGIVENVALFKPKSSHKRDYSPRAVGEIFEHLKSAKVYLDHTRSTEDEESRDPSNLLGITENPHFEGDTIFGNVRVNRGNKKFDLLEAAASVPDAIGMSTSSTGMKRWQGGREFVESLTRFFSIDVVSTPATTTNLLEYKGGDDVKWDEVTLRELKEQRGDLVAEILKEAKNTMDETKRVEELTEQVKAKETELQEAKQKLDALQVLEVRRQKKEKALTMVQEAKLPAEAVTDIFKESLERAEDEPMMKRLIEDRKALIEGIKAKPKSQGRDAMADANDMDIALTEEQITKGAKQLAEVLMG
ncbi:MAG: hypothetical protein Q8Q12_21590 [bacterium]|nr:hypothetical protein [bacterium]